MKNFKEFMFFRTEDLADKILALCAWLCVIGIAAIVGGVIAFIVLILNAE